jgi:hypothetical protein
LLAIHVVSFHFELSARVGFLDEEVTVSSSPWAANALPAARQKDAAPTAIDLASFIVSPM